MQKALSINVETTTMRRQTQPGSRSAPSIRMYSDVARDIQAERLREAENYRLSRQARQELSSPDRAARPHWSLRLLPSFARARLERR
jgi:hypothetical protein